MEWQDQAYARKKMVQYLNTLPSGQQVALFTLGQHLEMVQSFTGSTDTLIAAAKKLGALSSFKNAGGESQKAALDQMGNPSDSITIGSPQGGQSAAVAVLQGPPPGVHDPSSILQDFLTEDVREMGDIRVRMTLEGLRDLARTLGSIPGRKNLIWISGDFPALIGSYTEQSGLHPYDREIRTTAALLAAHQIAVYPVDARGLLTQPDASSAANTGRELLSSSTNSQNPYSKALDDFRLTVQSSHVAMDEMAEQTGGALSTTRMIFPMRSGKASSPVRTTTPCRTRRPTIRTGTGLAEHRCKDRTPERETHVPQGLLRSGRPVCAGILTSRPRTWTFKSDSSRRFSRTLPRPPESYLKPRLSRSARVSQSRSTI